MYKIQKKDIKNSAAVLADAFQNDPLWNKLFEGEPNIRERFKAFFEVPVRYCLTYGELNAVSEDLEGLIGWVPGEKAKFTFWRMIRSGSIIPGLKMGAKTGKQMAKIFDPVEKDRTAYTDGKSYIYVFVVGVATEFQGKGYGRKLIDSAIEIANQKQCLLYLETETEENSKMYEHFGFKLVKKVQLNILDLPLWEMVKEPE